MQVKSLALSLITILCAWGTTLAQDTSRPDLGTLMRSIIAVPHYEEVAISPNGEYIAWVESRASSDGAQTGSAIYLKRLHRANPALPVSALTQARGAGATENGLAWSPDSQTLAFLSDAEETGQLQLDVFAVRDRSIRQLTHLKGTVATPRWSPDGHRLAILFTPNANRLAGPLVAVPAPTGVIEDEILEQGLEIVDFPSGAARPLTAPHRYVYEYDWSPHSDAIVATGAHGSGDNNWYFAELFAIDLATGTERSLLEPAMQIADPRWSPDGNTIAFIGGLMSDESIGSGDLYLLPAAGGTWRNLTPTLSGSAFSFDWRADSRSIRVTEARAGGSAIVELGLPAGSMQEIWKGDETITGPRDLAFGLSSSAQGRTSAVIRESFNEPPSLWVGAPGRWTRFSPPPTATAFWGRAESVHWQSDGFDVQGWLVPPAHIDPSRRYPMIVQVHGGPAWLSSPRWPSLDSRSALFAAEGYFVFLPNARGSAGFGERFIRANVKDVGPGPLRDILAGVDAVVASHPIDDGRVGITGWSYGGYMTMWALTQTSRFRAAVAGAGVANWQSYYGENGIDEGLIPYFGASVYETPEIYAQNSPMTFIRQVRTPTLIVVGDSDVECPAPQSYEYWHALKTLHVKTQLIVYPHEGHEFSSPAHILDLTQRMLSWFDENMPPSACQGCGDRSAEDPRFDRH